MTELDLAEQLVAYVESTTEPVVVVNRRNQRFSTLEPDLRPEPESRRAWTLAAAAVAVLGLIGAIVLAGTRSNQDDVDQAPADTPVITDASTTPDVTEQGADDPTGTTFVGATGTSAADAEAIAAAEAYFAALAFGDVDAVVGASDLTTLDVDKETGLVRWWASAAWPDQQHPGWPSGPCGVASPAALPGSVRVECPVEVGDPVAAELGVSELVWPVEVARDGSITRGAEPYTEDFGNYAGVWSAYREYLDEFEPEGAAACDAGSYEPGSVWSPNGLVLSGDCAVVTSSLATDIAAWIAAGSRPRTESVALSEEYLHGFWLNTAGFTSLFVDFRRDGTFTSGKSGRLADGAQVNGTYEVIDDNEVVLRATACDGDDWTWTGVAGDDGVMDVVASAPRCGDEWEGDWQWTRVSPASPAGTALLDGDLDVPATPVTQIADVNGLWLRVGTGEVLAIDPEGAYLVTQTGDSIAPADTGTFSIDAAGVVRFVSDGSGECESGQEWTWQGVTFAVDLVRVNEARGTTMRAEASPTCISSDGGDAWRLLSPEKFAAG